jgi:hypothetical protein
MTLEEIYEHYARWCQSIGVTPAPYEYWRSIRG